MDCLALDQSKRNTGWARWRTGDVLPKLGSLSLGGSLTSRYSCVIKLQQFLHDQFAFGAPDAVFWETPRNPNNLMGKNSRQDWPTTLLTSALDAAIGTYCTAKRPPIFYSIDPDESFVSFCVGMKRNTRRKDRLDLLQERARYYGASPRNADEASAMAILDRGLYLENIVAPWRAHETLALAGGGR